MKKKRVKGKILPLFLAATFFGMNIPGYAATDTDLTGKTATNATSHDTTFDYVPSSTTFEWGTGDSITLGGGSLTVDGTGGTSDIYGALQAETGDLSITTATINIGNGGSILSDVTTVLNTGAVINISGTGRVELTSAGSDVLGGGSLNLTTGTLDVTGLSTTNTSITATAAGGTLKLNNMILNNVADEIGSGAAVTISNGLTITKTSANGVKLNANDTIGGTITMGAASTGILDLIGIVTGSGGATGGSINVQDGTLKMTDVTLGNGDIVKAAAATTITNGLNITNAAVELDALDSISGPLAQTGGSLTLTGLTTVAGTGTGKFNLNSNGGTLIANGLALESNDTIGKATKTTISTGTTLTINNADASVTLDNAAVASADAWDGNVTLTTGKLNLTDGFTKTTSSTSTYNQAGGTLTIDGASSLTLGASGGSIAGGTVDVKDTSSMVFQNGGPNSAVINTTDTANNLTIDGTNTVVNMTGGTVNNATTVTINNAGTFNVNGGTVTLSSADALTNGTLGLNTGGTLNLNDVTTVAGNFKLVANAGTLNAGGTGPLTLANAGDVINANVKATLNNGLTMSAGTVELNQTASDPTADSITGTITQTGGTLTLTDVTTAAGTDPGQFNLNSDGGALVVNGLTLKSVDIIGKATDVTINADKTLTIESADASVILNGTGAGGTADIWTGNVDLKAGALNLTDGFTKTTSSTSTYNQSAGTLTIDGASSLTLGASGGSIAGGIVEVKDTSSMIFNNGGPNSAVINTTDTANNLTIDGTNTVVNMTGGTVNDATTVTINNAGTFNVNGGTVTLNGAAGGDALTNGTLGLNTGGTLNLNDVATTANFKLVANAGTLNAGGTNALILANPGDVIDANVKATLNNGLTMSAGTVELNQTASDPTADSITGTITQTGGTLTLTDVTTAAGTGTGKFNLDSTDGTLIINGLTLESNDTIGVDADVTINAGTTLTINNADASVTLDGTDDDWAGNVALTEGTFKLTDALSKDTDDLNDTTIVNPSTYTQTGGDLVIENASSLTLNDGSVITGGTATLTDASSLIFQNSANGPAPTGALNYPTWSEAANSLVINSIDGSGNKITIDRGTSEYQVLDPDTGLPVDVPINTIVNMTGGEIDNETILTIKGGSKFNVENTATVNLDDNDALTSGTLGLAGGTLNINGDVASTAGAFNFDMTSGKLNVTAGDSLTLNNSADLIARAVQINLQGDLNINNGKVELNANGTATKDTWGNDANIKLANEGELYLRGNFDKTTTAASTYQQTGGKLTINGQSSLTLDTVDSFIQGGTVSLRDSSILVVNNTTDNWGIVNSNNDNANVFTLTGTGTTFDLIGGTIDAATQLTVDAATELIISGANVTYDVNDYFDVDGKITLTDNTAATPPTSGTLNIVGLTFESADVGTYYQDAGTLNLDASSIDIMDDSFEIIGGTVNLKNASSLIFNTDAKATTDTLYNLTDASNILFNNEKTNTIQLNANDATENLITIEDGTTVTTVGGVVNKDALVTLNVGSTLNIEASPYTVASVTMNGDVNGDTPDVWDSTINVNGGILVVDGMARELIGSDFNQQAGLTEFVNNSDIILNDPGMFAAGNILIDNTSKLTLPTAPLTIDNLITSGTYNTMNGGYEKHTFTDTLTVNNNNWVDPAGVTTAGAGVANFQIDIEGRCAHDDHQPIYDQFITKHITSTNSAKPAYINISDWMLAGDYMGDDAPIDRNIKMQIFNAARIDDNIIFGATDKTVKTPIGWYGLKYAGNGAFNFGLTKFNPQVFRGQVATVAQANNQLTINDIMFDHALILNQTLDDAYANKSAAIDPIFAPYQYTKEDGAIWFKPYGYFETLSMTQGLNVHNNAYGSLIGADLPAREFDNGWSLVTTPYIGYNGGHQTFNGVSMFQNGAQVGVLNTLAKDNLLTALSIYAGGYNNHMSVEGNSEDTWNYFVGVASKTAYNVNLPWNFVFQPTALFSYNYFGNQNWGSDYGVMSMKSGYMNGVNIAPGFNLIWQKETFSLYTTVEYMYNINDKVDGKAGHVNLPNVRMRHGYLEYGFGATKKFTDRFMSYIQMTFRNVGRTGTGFQLGFSWKF